MKYYIVKITNTKSFKETYDNPDEVIDKTFRKFRTRIKDSKYVTYGSKIFGDYLAADGIYHKYGSESPNIMMPIIVDEQGFDVTHQVNFSEYIHEGYLQCIERFDIKEVAYLLKEFKSNDKELMLYISGVKDLYNICSEVKIFYLKTIEEVDEKASFANRVNEIAQEYINDFQARVKTKLKSKDKK